MITIPPADTAEILAAFTAQSSVQSKTGPTPPTPDTPLNRPATGGTGRDTSPTKGAAGVACTDHPPQQRHRPETHLGHGGPTTEETPTVTAHPTLAAAPSAIIDCPNCGGHGETQPGSDPQHTIVCPACAGTGETARPSRPPVMACCGGIVGEHFDFCTLTARITDRRGARYVTPAGDSRQRPVPCRSCADPDVWALDALCDRCATREAERTEA